MPTLALLLWEIALGMLTASAASAELRASTRPVHETVAFRARCAHAACVLLPAGLFLLLRHPDWMVSYAFDGASIPSAVSLLVALLCAAAPLLGFAVGGRWVRAHEARRSAAVAAVVAASALIACVALRARVFQVGSWVQFRGGFGLQRLSASSLAPVLAAVALAQGAGWAWMVTRLRLGTRAAPSEPSRSARRW